MLFDLRGSGRRRVVKTVYITLAFLMGGGLVLFGIGGGGALPGGLVDAITQGGTGDDSTDRFREQEQAATARARANPTDAALWAAVARARFNLANAGENVDQNTGNYTDAGAEQLRAAGRAWDEHIKLAGNNPDSRVASLMVQAYAGLGEMDKATAAQEIIAEDRNSAGAYATLAQLAYQAGQVRKGDLARDKALELTEPDMREALKGQLESVRAQAATEAAGETPAPTATPEATTTPKPKDEK
jgi:tetratricopeptide (TPR) repeat protein